MEVFHYSLQPETAFLAHLRHSLATWLKNVGVTETPRANLLLATHEAAANAIVHAGSAAPVNVQAQIVEEVVTVVVADRGRWRKPISTSEERGRGLGLIATLVSKLEIEASDSGTTLRLIHHVQGLKLAGTESAATLSGQS